MMQRKRLRERGFRRQAGGRSEPAGFRYFIEASCPPCPESRCVDARFGSRDKHQGQTRGEPMRHDGGFWYDQERAQTHSISLFSFFFSLNCRRGGKDTEFIPMETESPRVQDERCPLCWLKKKQPAGRVSLRCSVSRRGRHSSPEVDGFIPTISSYRSGFCMLGDQNAPEIRHSFLSWGEPCLMTEINVNLDKTPLWFSGSLEICDDQKKVRHRLGQELIIIIEMKMINEPRCEFL